MRLLTIQLSTIFSMKLARNSGPGSVAFFSCGTAVLGILTAACTIRTSSTKRVTKNRSLARTLHAVRLELNQPKTTPLTARTAQVTKYWKEYGQVLVTNYRDFVLVGRDTEGKPVKLAFYRLSPDEKAFWRMASQPLKTARDSTLSCSSLVAPPVPRFT
jgi:hypothetical protein